MSAARRLEWLQTGLSVLTLAAAGALITTQAMVGALSHDEHQFVAAGRLIGAHGLLPYRDFPFHHLPNLPLLYALLGRPTPSLLLNARLLSALFGLGTAGLIYWFACRRMRKHEFWLAWLTGTAAVLFLVLSPLFIYTSGRAWNHALPTVLTLAACFLVLETADGSSRWRWAWPASGLLLGLAAGARASFLVALLPLGLCAFRGGSSVDRRQARGRLAALGGGAALGLAPTLWLGLGAPWRFLYGNLIYPLQNTQYRLLLSHDDAMNLPSKLGYFVREVLLDPPHLALAAGGAWLAWRALARPKQRERVRLREVWLLLGTALCLWLGALLPTPSWYQYYYAPLPFVVLAIVLLIERAAPQHPRLNLGIVAALVGLVLWRADAVGDIGRLARPADWPPLQVHRLGVAVAERSGPGRVLSLAPLVPLEGGLEVYPAFSTGSLTWRVSPFMDRESRQRYGVIAPEDLAGFLQADPPAAILVGFELANEGFSLDDPGGLERPLLDFARDHGYRRTAVACPLCVSGELQVWVAPDA